MAVELPEPLQWVLLLLAGCRWPEADEDRLRDMADHCRKAAEGLKDAAQSSDATIKRALDGQQGVAAEALGTYWAKFATGKGTQEDPGYLPGAINALDGMGDMLEQMANSAETAKIQIIAQLGILAFEIATAEAEAPFTAGASLLEVPVMIGASRAVVSTLLKTLLKEMITMAAKQAAQMAAINLLAQGIELAEGHRRSIDMNELGQNALGGAVGGASGHLIGRGIGGAGGKLGAEKALNSTVGRMATGAAVGVGADVSTQLITTGKVDGESLLGSGLSGGAGAGLHAGASAIKGHAKAPEAAGLPHLDVPNSGPRGGRVGSQDGPPTFSRSTASSGGGSYQGPTGEAGDGSAARSGDGGNGSGIGGGADPRSGFGPGSGSDTGTAPASASGPGSASGGSRVSGLTPFGSVRASETPSPVGSTVGGSHPAPATHEAESGGSIGGTRSFDPATQHSGSNEQAAARDQAPRQETTAPSHEPAATQPDAAPVTSRESSPPQPPVVHEPAAHEPAAQPVGPESAPRREQPSQDQPPSHEPSVAREQVSRQPIPEHGGQESVPPQDRPRPAPLTERGGHEGAPGYDRSPGEPVAERGSQEGGPREELPVPSDAPVHEQPAAAGASAGHGAPPVREAVAESSDAPPQRSAPEAVPHPSGVLGGAAHPGGFGGSTNLDGGTRLSGGQTPPRTEPEEVVPGRVMPDTSLSAATPNPTATPPVGGGFVPGPVSGGGTTGHQGGGRGRPASPVPSPPPAPRPPAARPGTSTGSGGTMRPGAGRDGDARPTPPPPPTTPTSTPHHSTPEGSDATLHTTTGSPVHEGQADPGHERQADPVHVTAADNRRGDGFREFTDGVDGNVPASLDTVNGRTGPEGLRRSTTPAGNESVPAPALGAGPDGDFRPPGPRVEVAGDGLCLLHSVAVSAPDLVGPHAVGPGGVARRLQSAVEAHFDELPPEHWPTEVVSNYRGHRLGRPDLGAGELLDHLPADAREAYAGLPLAELKQIVGEHLTQNAPPPSQREREALLRTVRNWEARWLTDEGEMLPAAAAHALGLRLRVVGHDRTPLAVFGPPDGRPVTVYHRGNHYDGSEPAASAPADARTPAAPREDAKTPVPERAAEAPAPSTDPTPQNATEEPAETGPRPRPQDTAGPRPITGADLVVGLTGNEAAVREKVVAVLERAVPGDRAAARAFADAHFGPATLRPVLGALSRGEVWTAPLDGGGWSGAITLRGRVTGSTHLRTEKIEFENGADRTVTVGTGRDAQWQYNVGVRAGQSGGIAEPAELAGYFHDRGHGQVDLDLGGMVARSKTSEPADVFRSTMRLELDFDGLRHEGVPVRTGSGGHTETVDLGLTVAVPVRPDAGSVGEQRIPPQRLRDGRVGGQEIVLDLAPRGGADGHRPVEALLDQVEQAARQEFGKDWPALREKVLAEVDFARLQRDLKSMTAGEPVTVTLTDHRGRTVGTVGIGARVGDLRQTGTTKETEFSIGTAVQQVRSTATNRGHAGQFGLGSALKPGAALIGVGGAGRLGRDRIEIAGDSRVAQLTSKSKVPGVRYEGAVHFAMSFNGKADTHAAGTADVRLLVDRADTAPEAVTPESAEHGTPRSGPRTSPVPGTDGTAGPPVHEVSGPPDSVWHGGDDRGGLGETVVVRDVESTAALRAAVDAKGRERFGSDWDAVRDQVMRGFSQPNLAARLTGMTRGEALQVKIPGRENLVVTAVARVESMTYRREDGKAELNTVNETSVFGVDRRLLARTAAAGGRLGGAVAKGAPGADLLATGSGQQRERAGGQGRRADRVYANGKYRAPQVVYGAELAVDVHLGRPGEAVGGRSDVSAPLRVEVGLDARDTVKVQAPRSEDGAIAFTRPTEPARGDRPAPTGRDAVELDRPTATHRAPRRMREQHELNASYVVHGLDGAGKVRTAVEDAVRSKYGEPSEEVRQRIGATFDRVALRTQLSRLTRGGKITETVSGATWKAEVTVTARLADATYHSTADTYEFESGTRTSRGQGTVRDRRTRLDGGGLLRMKAPFVNVAGGYAHRMDRSYGHGTETVGSSSNRGKHVEPAVFFDVETAYDVTVAFKRLNVPDGSHTRQVDTVARVAVPMRDADPVSGPVERITAKQPRGFVEGRRLDSSAIVTDVHALPDAARGTAGSVAGPRRTLSESLLSQVESGWKPAALRRTAGKPDGQRPPQPSQRNPFGGDWAGVRRKLDEELTPDRLQSRLKGMTAGDEIVVRHGRTTVRVGAVLRDRMEHLGDSGTTEFNTGTDVQRSFATADGTGHGHQGTLGATAAVPVPGAPVSVTVGATGTGGRGHDHADVRTSSTTAGSATKAKLPGSAYRGEAELQFTITRRPYVGASVHQRRTAALGFETIVESGETLPVPPGRSGEAAGAERPPRTLPVGEPEQVGVRIPPERVWETGLRDTDVLRWLGDVGGVQDLVRLRGPQFFGRSAWQEMEPVVGTVTSHSHLSALFGTASQGTGVAATVPTGRVTLGGGKGVEVGVKIVSLEHRDTDAAVELSPSNATSSGTVRSDLSAKNAGVQGQVGAKITGDVTTSPAITGGAQRLWREGGTHGDSGQTVSNGKFPTPMARYTGAAEVEVTLFDGRRNPVKEKGIVPFTVDIPLSETTGVDLPGDHHLAFTEDRRGGDLRFGDGAGLLDDVHRALAEGGRPFDHAAATPAEREQLMGTVRVGRAAFGGEFTTGTDTGLAHVRAAHRLVELAGGSSTATSALLGDLLGTPDGAALRAEDVRKVIDYVERKTAEGPVTLDDLVAGAQDGWPSHEPYEIHREAWTEHGPANELVTAAMAADAAGPLLRDGLPAVGRLYLTVSGEGEGLPLRQEFELSGHPEEQIRRIEEATYLKPGTRPSEVSVRLAGAPGAGHAWDFRLTARPEGSRELTLRHRRASDDQQPDDPVRTAAAASVTAATSFAAGRTAAPAESAGPPGQGAPPDASTTGVGAGHRV